MKVNKYKGKTVSEWAKMLGISSSAMYARIRKEGWKSAITKKKRTGPGGSRGVYNGKSINEWAKDIGISTNALYKRIRKEGIDKALSEKIKDKRGKKPTMYSGKSINEWAKELGVTVGTLRYRIKKRGWAIATQCSFRRLKDQPIGPNVRVFIGPYCVTGEKVADVTVSKWKDNSEDYPIEEVVAEYRKRLGVKQKVKWIYSDF